MFDKIIVDSWNRMYAAPNERSNMFYFLKNFKGSIESNI